MLCICFFRWCVLTGNSLDYYKSYVKNSPKFGSIVLNSLCSVVSPEEREPGKIQITTDRNGAMSQSEFEAITSNRRQARENARVQVTIGFGFALHWLKKWREFCWPITERSNAKPKQT